MSIDPEVYGFAALLSYVLAWVLIIGLARAAKDRPHTHRPADDASTGSAGRCPNCRRQVTGLAWVIVAEHVGGGLDRVCHGCAADGLKRGWFRASLPGDANVYDVLVAQGSADLDQIEAFANGEAS